MDVFREHLTPHIADCQPVQSDSPPKVINNCSKTHGAPLFDTTYPTQWCPTLLYMVTAAVKAVMAPGAGMPVIVANGNLLLVRLGSWLVVLVKEPGTVTI